MKALWAVCVAIAMAIAAAPPTHAHPEEIAGASLIRNVESAEGFRSIDGPLPAPDAWQPSTLPERWEVSRPETTRIVWYKLEITQAVAPDEHYMLFIPRYSNRIIVVLNGVEIYRDEPGEAHGWHWHRKLALELPPDRLSRERNEIVIGVTGVPQQQAGLAAPYFGTEEQIAGVLDWVEFRNKDLPRYSVLLALTMMLPLIFAWIGDGHGYRRGPLILSMAFYCIYAFYPQIEPIPLSPNQWWTIVAAFFFIATMWLDIFILRVAGVSSARLELVVGITALAAIASNALAALDSGGLLTWARFGWYAAFIVITFACTLAFLRHLLRDRRVVSALFFSSLVVWHVAAFHDLLRITGSTHYFDMLWLPIFFPCVMGTAIWAFVNRYLQAHRATQATALAARLRETQTRSEVLRRFESRALAEREAIAAKERAELLRDMHDGVGSRLALLATSLERGKLDPRNSAQAVREVMDEMKIIIDARDAEGASLSAVLSNLRHRLEPRLEAAGIVLAWEVDKDAECVVLPSGNTLQVLRIVQETIANAVRHSRAGKIALRVQLTSSRHGGRPLLVISIHDDGLGFDPAAAEGKGRGLRNLRSRAERIGAVLDIYSRPGGHGSTVRFYMPVSVAPADPVTAALPAGPGGPADTDRRGGAGEAQGEAGSAGGRLGGR